MDPIKNNEHRAYSRADIDVSVEVHSAQGPGAPDFKTMKCPASDISLTGMCIYSPILLQAGSVLQLNIALGEPARQFNLIGKVIWSNRDQLSGQFKTGIHLIKLPEDTAAWQSVVIQRLIG